MRFLTRFLLVEALLPNDNHLYTVEWVIDHLCVCGKIAANFLWPKCKASIGKPQVLPNALRHRRKRMNRWLVLHLSTLRSIDNWE